MKKILVLLLCLLTAAAVFTACGKDKDGEEDKGNTIPVYISTEIANFDPAYSNLDDASTRILGLIYEGLFKYDANGKAVKAGAKSVKILDDPSEDYYAIEIKLKQTSWSDGTQVQAADYVYAWKRILETEFRGEAANMLMGIKNAVDVNKGDMSIDDLGVSDVSTDVIRIEFEKKTDYNKFYEYLASPMLVPLREIAVAKVAKDWSSSSAIVVCNGPFCLRTYLEGEKMVLERNIYYRRDVKEDKLDKYVTPYRLSVNLKKDAAKSYADLNAGALVYDSEFALADRAAVKEDAKLRDTMSVMSCVFNTKVAPFDKPEVRTALSLALDRQAIADILVFAEPAKGVIGSGVFNTGYSRKAASFRDKGGELIASGANEAKAKELLNQAGVKGGDIDITLRNNEADVAVAEYIKGVWEKLGFKVTLNELKYKKYMDEKEYDLVQDEYLEKYENGDFGVILIDNVMISTDAFPNLAMYSKIFASGKMDMSTASDEYELATHISGYYSEEYDAKIKAAFDAENKDERAKLLHEAEEILVKDMPIMPLAELRQAVVTTSDLKSSSISTSYYGFTYFEEAVLKNASKYPDNEGYSADK